MVLLMLAGLLWAGAGTVEATGDEPEAAGGAKVAGEVEVIRLWPGDMPGPGPLIDGPEVDRRKPSDRLVGGRTVMKLGNVSQPEIHVFHAPPTTSNGAACVVCPGGGFSILAWDLEGTEVAEWLNSQGYTAVVLKYRVPTRHHGSPGKWQGPVTDAQRAISLVRRHAAAWRIDKDRIGILGFSAGGETAAMTAVQNGNRLYSATDAVDSAGCRPDFALLIYPGGIIGEDGELESQYRITDDMPPMFFAHAADDRVTCVASVELFLAARKAGLPAELHVYHNGGHGYGLRPDVPRVTGWPTSAAAWLQELGFAGGLEQ